MSSTLKLALVPALYALLLCACGPTRSDPDPNLGGQVTADNFDEKFTATTCKVLERCMPGLFGSAEQCRTLISTGQTETTFNTQSALVASIKAGKVTLDGAKAKTCLAALETIACDQIQQELFSIPGCEGVLKGNVALGGACITDEACANDNLCMQSDAATNACLATCQQKGVKCHGDEDCAADKVCEMDSCVAMDEPPGAKDEPCGTHSRCQPGLVCTMEASDGEKPTEATCQPPSDEGGACMSDDTCKTGLFCQQSEDGSLTGTCTKPGAPSPAGGPCKMYGSQGCQAGLSCIPDGISDVGTCLVPKKKGEACSNPYECGSLFGSITCDLITSVCVDKPTSGPCLMPFSCAPDKSYCDYSAQVPTCKLFKALGAQCSSDNECGPAFGSIVCEGAVEGMKGVCKKHEPLVCQP